MNYEQTLEFLFAQLPMYQRVGPVAYKKDLGNTLALCAHLGNPERKFKSIHVAGTNGKGSCSHMLASVFQQHGYKTGLYTSPHLIDFRERIRINGEVVSEAFVIDFVARVKDELQSIKPSFFEITVAMAFHYFAEEQVDIAIIETGLGGRLDSTNVITPELSVITNIGLDHTDMLGDTLEAIAVEKAGIIKSNIPVVIGERQVETQPIFKETANRVGTNIHFADELIQNPENYTSDLKGSYQRKNIRTVLAASEVLKEAWSLNSTDIQLGLSNVVNHTQLLGRWQVLQESPKVICDTGHNVEGVTELVQQLQAEAFDDIHIVFGQVTGKNPLNVLKLLPQKARYYFCQPSVVRALNVDELVEYAGQVNLTGEAFPSVSKAYSAALEQAKPNDLVFVGGSTFVVADLLVYLMN